MKCWSDFRIFKSQLTKNNQCKKIKDRPNNDKNQWIIQNEEMFRIYGSINRCIRHIGTRLIELNKNSSLIMNET